MKGRNDLFLFGGLAALFQGLGYVAFSVATLGLVVTQGFATPDDFQHPEQILTLAATHPAAVALLSVLNGGYMAHAVCSFVVIVALIQVASKASLNHKFLAFGPALINSTLYLAAAATDLSGLPAFVHLYAQHPDEAIAGYRVLGTFVLQCENVAGAAYGLSVIVICWAMYQRRTLPRSLCILGMIWGAVALLSWPFFIVAALGFTGILWCGWLGVVLIRLSASSINQNLMRKNSASGS